MTKHLIDLYKRVRHILDDPKKRTKGTYARNGYGCTVSTVSPQATCFCLSGAFTRAAVDLELNSSRGKLIPYKNTIAPLQETVGKHIPEWNDHQDRTHGEVIAALDTTIARLEADNVVA